MIDVVGLDPSLTGTGMVGVHEGEMTVETFDGKKIGGLHRLASIRDRVMDFVTGSTGCTIDSLVVIEGISFSSSSSMAHEIGGLGYILRLALYEAHVPILDVPPATLKKFATGKGNTKKPAMVSQVTNRSGRTFDDDNQADAFALYCLGLEMLGRPHPMGQLPAEHRKALDKLELPKTLAVVS